MSIDFTEDEVGTLHTALINYQSHLGPHATSKADQVTSLLKRLRPSKHELSFDPPADKAKDKVKAPAVSAVDWTIAEPKKKPKDEGRERRK